MAVEETELDTSNGRAHGLNQCPQCGSTEVRRSGREFICGHCRTRWASRQVEAHTSAGIEELTGTHVGLGAKNIDTHASDLVTIKCQGCGGEIVVHTAQALQAKCHWCRQVLSINHQIPNGIVPDLLLPFQVDHKDAVKKMRKYIHGYGFWADKSFRKDFAAERIVQVYLPYVLMDGNFTMSLEGMGEKSRGMRLDSEKIPHFKADQFKVRRNFHLYVDDLAVESSADYQVFDESDGEKKASAWNVIGRAFESMNQAIRVAERGGVTNIINGIQPFDTENAVGFDANLLMGTTSERRDLNLAELEEVAMWQARAIGREHVAPTVQPYDRGVVWTDESIGIVGSRWLAIYLPVWLYTYRQTSKEGVHADYYVAVNGRTGQTEGSIPVSTAASMIASIIPAAVTFVGGIALTIFLLKAFGDHIPGVALIGVFVTLFGPILVFAAMVPWIVERTVKLSKTHHFESSVRSHIDNLAQDDEFMHLADDLRLPKIDGRNDHRPRQRAENSTAYRVQSQKAASVEADAGEQPPADDGHKLAAQEEPNGP